MIQPMFKVGDIIQAIDIDKLGDTQWLLTEYYHEREFSFESITVVSKYERVSLWSLDYLIENMRVVNPDELPYSHRS